MPTSTLKANKVSAAHNSNVAWNGDQMFERQICYRDTVSWLSTDVARTAATGGVMISTAGVATFQNSQAAVLSATPISGVYDYFNIARGGVNYKFTIVSGATTSWVVTPAPTTAFGVGNVTIVDDGATSTSTFATAPGLAVGDKFITATGGVEYTVTAVLSATTFTTTPDTAAAAQAWGHSYVPVNVGSYVDFPTVGMPGIRPTPEQFRMRWGGTGTATAATFQFVRVNALTGVETAITTAVATTSAAIWQGVDITPFGEEPAFGSSNVVQGTTQEFPVDEFVRLVITAKTTLTVGRTALVEMGLVKDEGPNCFSASP